jgi:regulator of RNase E activity RraB
LYFYTADGPAFENMMKEAMRDFAGYSFQTGSRPDPEWKVCFDFLYPSPLQEQQIANRSVIDNLIHHGDPTDQPRQIDHFAYFPDQQSCDAFEAFVRAEGFSVSQPGARRPDGSFGLVFSKTGIPDNIDSITLPLFQDALDHGGEYDGWGCPVVS